MKTYIKKQKLLLLFEVFISLLNAISKVVLSFQMGTMTNAAVDGRPRELELSAVYCVICLGLCYVFQIITTYFRKKISGNCIRAIKNDLYHAFSRSGIGVFHKKPDSYYFNLLHGDMDLLERDYFDSIWRAINLILQVILCAAAMLFVSPQLFVIFTVVSFAAQFISKLFKKSLQKSKDQFSTQNEACMKKTKEFVCGFDTISYFLKQDLFIDSLRAEDLELENKRTRRDVSGSVASNGSYTINMISSIICMAVAAYLVAIGNIRFGALTTSTQLLNFMFTPLNSAIAYILAASSTNNLQKKFLEFIHSEQNDENEKYNDGDICFNDVSAGYGDKIIISDFTYRIEKGKKYAIIGASGIGKSTLASVIMKNANIMSGAVTIGDINIQEISIPALYNHVLYIPQDTFLFDGTVLDNISFWGDAERAKTAARSVSLPENLLSQKTGSDNGKFLSGGEQTRINIARALLSDASVLIFDEPTKGLDPSTASEIESLLLSISGKTVIVITHNWSEEYLNSFDGIIRL
jgi:ATP-binding cassette subfamily B protein